MDLGDGQSTERGGDELTGRASLDVQPMDYPVGLVKTWLDDAEELIILVLESTKDRVSHQISQLQHSSRLGVHEGRNFCQVPEHAPAMANRAKPISQSLNPPLGSIAVEDEHSTLGVSA